LEREEEEEEEQNAFNYIYIYIYIYKLINNKWVFQFSSSPFLE
jgi:hypothetical protein